MDNYCKIFLDSPESDDKLLQRLYFKYGGKINMFTLITPEFEIYIDANEDHNPQAHVDKNSEFLYYPLLVEIDFACNLDKQIMYISDLLNFFWNDRLKAVATCDFEDKLPKNPYR